MLVKYGKGWLKFPDVVWMHSRGDYNKWVSRAVTTVDKKRRVQLGKEVVVVTESGEVIT